MRFDPNQYDDVNSRIDKFWEQYPQGRIVTALKSDPNTIDEVVFQAFIYTDREDKQAVTTGWASEKRGSGGANNTHHVENAETSAIGRALANFNFKTHKDAPRPSRQEMEKPQRERAVYDENEPLPRYGNNTFPPRQNKAEQPQAVQNFDAAPTERQLETLRYYGYEGTPANRGEASAIISRLKAEKAGAA